MICSRAGYVAGRMAARADAVCPFAIGPEARETAIILAELVYDGRLGVGWLEALGTERIT